MPELPEVETIVQEMREIGLIGSTIERAEVFWQRSLANLAAHDFCQQMANQHIHHIRRRGKLIVFCLDNCELFVHLRMTGKFILEAHASLPRKHERVRLYLADGRILRYEDQRKFGKWYLLKDSLSFLKKIGLEPLTPDFSFAAFAQLLKGRKRQIKPFLLDQQFVAGLGNIYVDEALWEAKIHPTRDLSSLTADELNALHTAIINVLQRGVANTGTTLGSTSANYFSVSGRPGTNQHALKVFRRHGQPCPRCSCPIEKITVAQRGTHVCPSCQKLR